MEERNPLLTTGLSPVYQRFISRARSAFCSWLPNNEKTLFVSVNPYHAGHVREFKKPMEEQNPRLTTGSSAVYQRDEKRSPFLAANQCTDALSV